MSPSTGGLSAAAAGPAFNCDAATAADLADMFTAEEPDFEPFVLQKSEPEVFVPSRAKDPKDPQPAPRLDDPRFVRQQHQR